MQGAGVLVLSDLRLILEDMLSKRREALTSTGVGRAYVPILEADLTALKALPASQRGLPLAQALADKDAEHDALGRAIRALTEAYMTHPGLPEATRQAARRIQDAFIPSLLGLKHSYADEAARAGERRQAQEALKDDLARLPALGASGPGTLADWVGAFLDAGEELGRLLSERGDQQAASRADAALLRSRIMGHLSRLRAALADEASVSPSTPADLDQGVFGYVDTLVAQRAARPKAGPGDAGDASDAGDAGDAAPAT